MTTVLSRWTYRVTVGAIFTPIIFFGTDYIWNGNEFVKRQRVRYAITKGNLKLAIGESFEIHDDTSCTTSTASLFQPHFLPTVLIAPVQSGKSMLLSNIARECRSKQIPVLYFPPMRGNKYYNDSGKNCSTDDTVRMYMLTKELLNQLNYPIRKPWITSILKGSSNLNTTSNCITQLDEAMACLSAVCNEIKNDGKNSTMDDLHTVPILLFDEMHELTDDSNFSKLGGRAIFDTITQKIAAEGIKLHRFRTVIAATNAKIIQDIHTSDIRDRWVSADLPDPSEVDDKVALKSKGYTEDESTEIIDLVGLRRGLIAPLICFGNKMPVSEFIRNRKIIAASCFNTIFDDITDENDKTELTRILDSLAQGKYTMEYIASFSPSIKKLLETNHVPLLFHVKLDSSGTVVEFQSDVIRHDLRIPVSESNNSVWKKSTNTTK